ncbi:MAG: ATP-binding cassette domain-containing protein [Planctomycetes bacterium]|nr:ATP-binding cassette domain-containing protein [Planctomycetota bacterium]
MSDANGPIRDEAVIRLRDVYKSFGRLRVLQGVNLDFIKGQTTVVIGPSGCGKSVMLKHIVGLLRPDRGEVYYEGHRVDQMNEHDLVEIRTDFGYLFQLGALFDSMTVEQNVCFPLEEHANMTLKERRERCAQVLGMVGMEHTQRKVPAELSGGQRKRIALARAVALHPKVILYDEPTTGLDPIRSDVINELIIKLQKELHATSIVVTHDMTSAYKIADRIVMLYDGHIIVDGSPDEVRATDDPIVRAFIEGRSDLHQIDGLESASESRPAGKT